MKRPYKMLLAALLCAAPLGVLLPGCGGGGGGKSATGPFRLETNVGLEFNGSPDTILPANLQFQEEDTPNTVRRITGRLQVFARRARAVTPTAFPQATALVDPTPIPGNDPFGFRPAGATYIIRGTITVSSNSAPAQLDAVGSLAGGPSFRITGLVQEGEFLTLIADFNAGSGVLIGLVQKDPYSANGGDPNSPTPIPTVTGSPAPTATATTIGTPVPTTTAIP